MEWVFGNVQRSSGGCRWPCGGCRWSSGVVDGLLADVDGLLADVDGLLADVDGFLADVDGLPRVGGGCGLGIEQAAGHGTGGVAAAAEHADEFFDAGIARDGE